jgi:cysteine synthase
MPVTSVADSVLNAIVRLRRIVGAADADVVIKLEALNLTGSYKDHMALALIAAVLILVGR